MKQVLQLRHKAQSTMSETSSQKLLVAMTCVFGVVLVLIGYGKQRGQSSERLPRGSKPAIATRSTTPIPTHNQPISTGRVISRTNQSTAQWQSMPVIARTPSNENFAPTRQLPANTPPYNNHGSVENYFTPSTTVDSPVPSRAPALHPSAQKINSTRSSITAATPPSSSAASKTTKLAGTTAYAVP